RTASSHEVERRCCSELADEVDPLPKRPEVTAARRNLPGQRSATSSQCSRRFDPANDFRVIDVVREDKRRFAGGGPRERPARLAGGGQPPSESHRPDGDQRELEQALLNVERS